VFRGSDIGTDHIELLKETPIRDTYKRRMTEYSKDCPSSENTEEEWRLISEIIKTTERESPGTKNKTKKKKGLYIWN
jgi:uncharacterized protein YrzB (UPF0473 family)